MSGFAGTPREAESAWISAYPFALKNGGLGNYLSLDTGTGSSSRQALVGTGFQVLVQNTGLNTGHIAFGDSTVVADTRWTAIMPGIPYTLSIPEDATHVAGISPDGPTKIQITRGAGN